MAVAVFVLSFTFSSCGKKNDPLIIWTSESEIVSYVELFNATHDDTKAVVIYKEETARALPPAKDEVKPDIVIAPWLKNSSTRKNFIPVDYLFQDKSVSRSSFYNSLLNYGSVNDKQYLIPVSFNIPLMIYSKKNEYRISGDHYLTVSDIRNLATDFNDKNKNDSFTAMGYGPSWDSEFLYLVTRLNGVSYREKGISFSWNNDELESSIEMIKDWTSSSNTDTLSEQNFQFRYLYMPDYRQVTTGRCLFSCVESNRYFTLTDAQMSELSFRWLSSKEKIPVDEDIVTMGIYKGATHTTKAERFITWFMNEETQRLLIARTEQMKLNTVNFGIVSGFSSLKEVNEKYYPAYYRQLLGNLPTEESLEMPDNLPPRWTSLKSKVIIPFLEESTKTDNKKPVASLEERITEWNKQFF